MENMHVVLFLFNVENNSGRYKNCYTHEFLDCNDISLILPVVIFLKNVQHSLDNNFLQSYKVV